MCILQKSLYCLKQTPKQWYKKFDSFMSSNSFRRCHVDHCCYIKNNGNLYIILLLYVSDMLIAFACKQEIYMLKNEFAKQILGMRIIRDRNVLKLLQQECE